jgi:hypothetical protein
MTPDLRPGDVINTVAAPHSKLGRIFNPVAWLQWGIRHYQKDQEHFPVWDETHTMLYLGPGRIFSMTWPRGMWERWESVSERQWRVYRPAFDLSAVDLEAMRWQADRFIGRVYDLGQNLAIEWDELWGAKPSHYSGAFDWGQYLYSCSNSVAVIFETARGLALRDGRKPPFDGQLFSEDGAPLNDNRVCPACYSNSPRFSAVGAWDSA